MQHLFKTQILITLIFFIHSCNFFEVEGVSSELTILDSNLTSQVNSLTFSAAKPRDSLIIHNTGSKKLIAKITSFPDWLEIEPGTMVDSANIFEVSPDQQVIIIFRVREGVTDSVRTGSIFIESNKENRTLACSYLSCPSFPSIAFWEVERDVDITPEVIDIRNRSNASEDKTMRVLSGTEFCFDITVREEVFYLIDIRYGNDGSASENSRAHLSIMGEDTVITIPLPPTGTGGNGWNTFNTVRTVLPSVNFTSGTVCIRLEESGGTGVEFDRIDLIEVTIPECIQ